MDMIQSLVNEGEKQVYQTSWKEFFYDPAKVCRVKAVIDPQAAAEVLKAGLDWDGEGWNTALASRRLFELTRVPLVSADFSQYRNSFLFALSLYWEVDVLKMDLSDRASEAAFGLASLFAQDPSPVGLTPSNSSDILVSHPH